jgi:predicted GTPase
MLRGEARGVHLELRCRVDSSLVYDVVDDADRDPVYAAQRDFIATSDMVIFVVDSQRERLAASASCFEHLRVALARLGRDPASIPVVFALNKRDLPNIASVAELRTMFQSLVCKHVETVAHQGQGIDGLVDAVFELGAVQR